MKNVSQSPPPEGEWIIIDDHGDLVVPDSPILGFIEGDGVGSDVWSASRPVFEAAVARAYGGARRIYWWEIPAGEKSFATWGSHLTPQALEAVRRSVIVIKGPLTTPVGGGHRSINVTLRRELDLYACVRPVRHIPGTPSPVLRPQDVDMVIFRENTEDVYAGIEWPSGSTEAAKIIAFLHEQMSVTVDSASGIGIKPMSPSATKRLFRRAIRHAKDHGLNRVTLVHKGNIMKFTEGAFRDWGYELAREEFGDLTIFEDELDEKYHGEIPAGRILVNDRIADSMFQQILLRPKDYQVLAMPNLNGDYMSDALAAQVGGLGMAPGANIGDTAAVFEATHGSAPRYAGLDKVNPGSMMLSGAMMFEHMGWKEAADLIIAGMAKAIGAGTVTYDLARLMPGSTEVSCSGFGRAVISFLEEA